MPLIQQFYVSDEQFEVIEKAKKLLEPRVGESAALATLLSIGAVAWELAPDAAQAAKPAPAKKTAKRR